MLKGSLDFGGLATASHCLPAFAPRIIICPAALALIVAGERRFY
jgi:hypothetical protein